MAHTRTFSSSKFRLWAPSAEKVYLCLLKDNKKQEIKMEKSEGGTWFIDVKENLKKGSFFLFY
ncbi:MAG TPA: hypothetical protein DEA61_10425 [Caldanaerobacter subterraneus]|uniref:Glycoside hydrolase family 13 N-terminal domain-containing protein n=1 Tax=Caldanaerobacter subterraneus TaxID=911092 RepID=A0A357VP57_9THEO|nr:hypothetical protein [Caldanaerobacter subterraneus]